MTSDALRKTAAKKLAVLIGILVVISILPPYLPMNGVFNTWSYQLYYLIAAVPIARMLRTYMGHTIYTEVATALVTSGAIFFLMFEIKSSVAWKNGSFRRDELLMASLYATVLVIAIELSLKSLGLDKSAMLAGRLS